MSGEESKTDDANNIVITDSDLVNVYDFNVDNVVFTEIKRDIGKDPYKFDQIDIKYDFGGNIRSFEFILPEFITRQIKEFIENDDDGNITKISYVSSIALNPDNEEHRLVLDMYEKIYMKCYIYLFEKHGEGELEYMDSGILDMIRQGIEENTIDGKNGSMGLLNYPIKYPPKSRVGGKKNGKVIDGSIGYLSCDIVTTSKIDYFLTKFIKPREDSPKELQLKKLLKYVNIKHVSVCAINRIFIGGVKSVGTSLRTMYVIHGEKAGKQVKGKQQYEDILLNRREELEQFDSLLEEESEEGDVGISVGRGNLDNPVPEDPLFQNSGDENNGDEISEPESVNFIQLDS